MNIKRKNIMVVFSIIFIMLLFCLILYQPFMNFLDNPQLLRHYLQSFGFLGIIIYMMIMSIQVIFVFLPGEIVERFVQGDKSRNTSGSGLGLAIVKSFVEIQGGLFHVAIDGDLSKTTIQFKKKSDTLKS